MTAVLITGDRAWEAKTVICKALRSVPQIKIVVHGACTGADIIAGSIATELKVPTYALSADWSKGKCAGPIRNQAMVDFIAQEKCHIVLAFHDNLASSKGTRDCVKRALKAKIPVYLFNSKGESSEITSLQ